MQGNNTGLSNLTVNKADWMRDDKVRILLQYGTERLAALKDVPTVVELAGSEPDRAMLRFYALKFATARPHSFTRAECAECAAGYRRSALPDDQGRRRLVDRLFQCAG